MPRKKQPRRDDPAEPMPPEAIQHLRAGLAVLLRAYDYARDAQADVWDFAIEMAELRAAGLTISDLRWLVAKEFVSHGRETTVYGDPHRSFRPAEGLTFLERTAFALTKSGASFARQVHQATAGSESPHDAGTARPATKPAKTTRSPGKKGNTNSLAKPRWDAARRELSVGETVIKSFRVPAPHQECILAVFQEEGWPERIDDPLPGTPGVVSKQRLHNAINRLNGGQTLRFIRFQGNGHGNGIAWRFLASNNGYHEPDRNQIGTRSELDRPYRQVAGA